MATHRTRTFTGLGRGFITAGIVLTVAGLVLGFQDIVRAGVLLLALAVLALLFARRPAPRIEVRRAVTPPMAVPDERAQVEVTFANRDRRSSRLYLAEERIDYLLGDRPRFVVARLEPGAARQVQYVVRSHLRGRYQLGPVSLTQRDPFGLTQVTHSVDHTDELLVLPRVHHLGSSHPPGSGVGADGQTPQMVALHGEEDVSIRSYHDGDDLRKVHWPATAHRGELMVRQEDRPARRSAIVLLDSRVGVHTSGGPASSFEWAVSAVASVVVRLDQLGYRTKLVTREAMGRTAENLGDRTTDQLVIDLASVQCGPDEDFTQVLAAAHEQVTTGSLTVAVVAAGGGDTGAELAGLRQPGAAALGFVLDPGAFTPGVSGAPGEPSSGALLVRDQLAAAGWRVVVVDPFLTVQQAWSTVTNKALVQVGSL